MSGRDYKKLIDIELSKKLNASFNLQVLTKIDDYIQKPDPPNDINLDDLETAFTEFFENSSTHGNFTNALTDSELYKRALHAAETKVKETEEEMDVKLEEWKNMNKIGTGKVKIDGTKNYWDE